MKVLLRDEQTRLYYAGEKSWVAEPARAVDFRVLQKAGQKARGCEAEMVSVVLQYEIPAREVALNPAYCV